VQKPSQPICCVPVGACLLQVLPECLCAHPGCICYMISCLQQFYMVPLFRQAILNLPFGGSSGFEVSDDSFLHQLYLTFGHLQESVQSAYDLHDFCNAFKDFEGMPTNIAIQQDASEFLTNFFQHLESDTMGSSHESLLKETFGGVFSNELLAAGGKYSERMEQFYFISLSISGQNIKESLEAFIQGETVDYTWEETDPVTGAPTKESLPTTKRVSIAQPPNHLVLHLKRFEFDFETMMQKKLDSRFEFPIDLNIFSYTKQHRLSMDEDSGGATEKEPTGREDGPEGDTPVPAALLCEEDCAYTLAGVVVHAGTAHSGHYYSFIKERGRFSSDEDEASELPQWFEFNDSLVTEFDFEQLDEETFGGSEGRVGEGEGSVGASAGKQKGRNAFMLVYDRCRAKDLPIDFLSQSHSSAAAKYLALVQEPLASSLWQDNIEYWLSANLFDAPHMQFVSDLLETRLVPGPEDCPDSLAVSEDQDGHVLKCIMHFSLGTLVRAKATSMLCTWIPRVSKLVARSSGSAEHFLSMLISSQESGQATSVSLRELLLGLSEPQAQRQVSGLLAAALACVMPQAMYDPGSSLASRFLTQVASLLREAQLTWKNIRFFFEPFRVFASFSDNTALFSVAKRMDMTRLLAFMLGERTHRPELVGGPEKAMHRSRMMVDGFSIVPLDSLLETLSSYLDMYTRIWEAHGKKSASPLDLLEQEDIEILQGEAFLSKLMRQFCVYRVKDVAKKILAFIVFNSEAGSSNAINAIKHVLIGEDGLNCKGPMRAAMYMFSGEDSHTPAPLSASFAPVSLTLSPPPRPDQQCVTV
jgi:ubiquitin C-terminal hydrolase